MATLGYSTLHITRNVFFIAGASVIVNAHHGIVCAGEKLCIFDCVIASGSPYGRRIREEFVPIVKKAKGFVRYYWLDTGKGEGASVSVFKDKAGADESVRLAADYVQTHLSKLRIQKPEIIEGPIKAHD